MASPSINQIVLLAAAIQQNTAKLDAYFITHGLPTPSFDVDFPNHLPTDIESARNSILEATDELIDLMLGPRQLAECLPPQHTAFIGIQAIVRFGIATQLGLEEQLPFVELATRCDLPIDDLVRILRQAMSRHIFKEPRPGIVAHNAASRWFVKEPGINDWLYMCLDEMWPAAAHTVDAMEQWKGSSEADQAGFNLAKSTSDSFFASMQTNARRQAAFANVMTYMQTRPGFGDSTAHLLASFDWASAATIVDIGGGLGTMAIAIARNQPMLQCVVQDLPDTIATAREQVPPDVAQQLRFMPHDFFQEQPVRGADVYLLRWVLHDWSDAKAAAILRALVPALKNGASIVLQEFIIPEPGVLSFYHEKTIRCMDLAMKATFNSKEREVSDWIRLFMDVDARFEFVDVKVPLGSNLAVLHIRWKE